MNTDDLNSQVAIEDESWLGGNAQSILYVLSGPGGTGKSTLIKRWREDDNSLGYVRNYTTRAQRPPCLDSGIDDRDWYEFVTPAEFKQLVLQNFFVQWSHAVKGYLSGTPRLPIEQAIKNGTDLVFDYTPQLYLNLRQSFPKHTVGILLVPPNLKELASRLRSRGGGKDSIFKMKLEMGRQDLAYYNEHEYIVTNENLDEALEILKGIRIAEKVKLKRRTNLKETYSRLLPQPRPMLFYYDPFGYRIDDICDDSEAESE